MKYDPCAELRQRLRDDAPLAPAHQAHLDECDPCRTLAEDGGELARALGTDEAAAPDIDAILEGIGPEIERRDRLRDRLTAAPTPARVCLVVAIAALVTGLVAAIHPRPDLADYPALRHALVLGGLTALTFLYVQLALRPLYRPEASAGRRAATFALGLGSLLLVAGTSLDTPFDLEGGRFAVAALHCLSIGTLCALPVLAAANYMGRGAFAVRWALFGAAAVAANATLHVFCPIEDAGHIVVGHAGVFMLFVLLARLTFRRR